MFALHKPFIDQNLGFDSVWEFWSLFGTFGPACLTGHVLPCADAVVSSELFNGRRSRGPEVFPGLLLGQEM